MEVVLCFGKTMWCYSPELTRKKPIKLDWKQLVFGVGMSTFMWLLCTAVTPCR